MLFFFQASKKVPFDDPNVLNGVRAMYVLSNVVIAAIYFYMQYKIDQKKGTAASLSMSLPQHPVRIIPRHCPPCTTTPLTPQHTDLTTLKYVEPAPMGSQDDPKLVTTTNHAYDTNQVRTSLKGQVVGVAIMAFMHLYLKYTNPLLVQSIIPLKGALEGNLAKLWLFGYKDQGDLKRPWKSGGGLMAGMMGAGGADAGPKTDRASIEAAEKAGRGGQKEE